MEILLVKTDVTVCTDLNQVLTTSLYATSLYATMIRFTNNYYTKYYYNILPKKNNRNKQYKPENKTKKIKHRNNNNKKNLDILSMLGSPTRRCCHLLKITGTVHLRFIFSFRFSLCLLFVKKNAT